MTKDEYIKMLYDRIEYLKSEISDFENCNGGVEQARLWAIKEQVSRIFGLLNECDKELFPDSIRCAKTNEEWLRQCSTEELVKMILDLCDDRPCFACGIGYCDDENWCHVYSDEAREFVLEWLKQPHTIKE